MKMNKDYEAGNGNGNGNNGANGNNKRAARSKPTAPSKRRACVNCERVMVIAQNGLCGGCFNRVKDLHGAARSLALGKAKRDFNLLEKIKLQEAEIPEHKPVDSVYAYQHSSGNVPSNQAFVYKVILDKSVFDALMQKTPHLAKKISSIAVDEFRSVDQQIIWMFYKCCMDCDGKKGGKICP